MATNTRKLASLLGASGAGIADAGTLTSAAIGEVIVASDIAAGAVGSSEIATNAVGESELSVDYTTVKPHIIPGKLYPAVAGKLLDGSTSHSGAYGTAQSDGKSYYYTDIKGSKPIKDPRIGAHFGSQRHKFTSSQLLEQETATHGKNVYSFDGREWCRVVIAGSADLWAGSNQHGSYIQFENDDDFIEITGYFNDINFIMMTHSNRVDDIDISVNGTLSHDGNTTIGGRTAVYSPLVSRYVAAGSVINAGATVSTSLGTSPKINTLKLQLKNAGSEYFLSNGIELIAQDTTSTATKSQIQIPSQNVVSYGKKFTVSGTPHYDPFNGFTNSTTLHSAVVDTATSLGLSSAPGSSASWAISASNNIRPYNGGRVVKWVDSSGVIKTSVNMMPPNAQNILGTVVGTTEVTTPSATNATYTPIFSDDAIDHSQAEVAKTFHTREFGNGGANYNATYKDCSSQANATQGLDIAYVMDDGLTSLSGGAYFSVPQNDLNWGAADDYIYFTFIGTGFSKDGNGGNTTFAQNLPYGTHIVKLNMNSSATWYSAITVDGVSFGTSLTANYYNFSDVSFHQPKMPPIPEDAVVIADYMLMADFVAVGAGGIQYISKGVRVNSVSRDMFHDVSTGAIAFSKAPTVNLGFSIEISTSGVAAGSLESNLPSFGTNFVARGEDYHRRDIFVDGSDVSQTDAASSVTGPGAYNYPSAVTLGVHTFTSKNTDAGGSSQRGNLSSFEIASPIHTSSHYQTFETPFLHELVGGDRNMEQTNLVVTPDGQTWDEVTRDVRYIGDVVLSTAFVTGSDITGYVIWDEWRGQTSQRNMFNKDVAIAYDRLIFLKDGYYHISMNGNAGSDGTDISVKFQLNGDTSNVLRSSAEGATSLRATTIIEHSMLVKRGDYIQFYATNMEGYDDYMNGLQIRRLN